MIDAESDAPRPAKSASERASESRAAKLAAGYVAKSVLLPPAAVADLAALRERDGVSDAEAIARALALANQNAPAAPLGAANVVSPEWFKPQTWERDAGGGWICSGLVDPPQPVAIVRGVLAAGFQIGATHWPARWVKASAIDMRSLAAAAIVQVEGEPPRGVSMRAAK